MAREPVTLKAPVSLEQRRILFGLSILPLSPAQSHISMTGSGVILVRSGICTIGGQRACALDAFFLADQRTPEIRIQPDGAAVAIWASHEPRGPAEHWHLPAGDVAAAMEPNHKVKIVEASLWKEPCPPGRWLPGTEIQSSEMALSFFRDGATESAHSHKRTTEAYVPTRGQLSIRTDMGPLRVTAGQCLVLPPQAPHLVEGDPANGCTMVLQRPPADGDKLEESLNGSYGR